MILSGIWSSLFTALCYAIDFRISVLFPFSPLNRRDEDEFNRKIFLLFYFLGLVSFTLLSLSVDTLHSLRLHSTRCSHSLFNALSFVYTLGLFVSIPLVPSEYTRVPLSKRMDGTFRSGGRAGEREQRLVSRNANNPATKFHHPSETIDADVIIDPKRILPRV